MRAALAALVLAACAAPGPPRGLTVVPLGPQAPVTSEEAGEAAQELAAWMADGLSAALPDELTAEDSVLFGKKDEWGRRKSRSALNALDLTGIGWGRGAVVTLITDSHAIVAAHVPRPVGSLVVFYDKEGFEILRSVAAKTRVPREAGTDLDLAVVRLDQPVPADIMVYPLPAVAPQVAGRLGLHDAPVLVTYKGRRASVGSIAGTSAGGLRVLLRKGSRRLGVPEALGHAAERGDSSHPSFWVVDGRMLLASHYHADAMAGIGPNYADARVRAAIEAAIAVLDEAD